MHRGHVPGTRKLAALLAAALLGGPPAVAQPGPPPGGGPGGGGPPGRPGDNAVAVATFSEEHHTISVGGRLRPLARIEHQAGTSGYVTAIRVRLGQAVQAGDELLSIRRKDDVLDLYKPAAVSSRAAGRVSEILVQVQDEVNASTPVAVIVDTSGYRLEAKISDKDAFHVEVGQPVQALSAGGARLSGTLVSRSAEPDYDTGLYALSFEFPNSQRTDIGEFVLVELPIDTARGVFVPRDAVVRRYGRYILWLVDEGGLLKPREVTLGAVYGEKVLLQSGLKVGERYLRRLTGRETEGAQAPRG